jgi:hypothetical protein
MADPPWAPASDSLTSLILLNEREGGRIDGTDNLSISSFYRF